MNDRPEEMDERDVEERFASIVAGWDAGFPDSLRADDGRVAGPDGTSGTADASAEATPTRDQPPGPAAPGPVDPVNPSPLDALPGAAWRAPGPAETAARARAEREDEHYEPPAVQLPPHEDLHFWGAVVGLVAGPLLLLWVALVRPEHGTRWFLAALALSLGGFALLVLRQPRDRDEDDDGARV